MDLQANDDRCAAKLNVGGRAGCSAGAAVVDAFDGNGSFEGARTDVQARFQLRAAVDQAVAFVGKAAVAWAGFHLQHLAFPVGKGKILDAVERVEAYRAAAVISVDGTHVVVGVGKVIGAVIK